MYLIRIHGSSPIHQSFFFGFLLYFLNPKSVSCSQSMQDEMMDMMDISSEIQESLGRSYSVPDDIDEEELMGGKLELLSLFPPLY